jgi:hypothetical protein
MTDRKACVLRLHEILDRAFCDACKSDEQIARETNIGSAGFVKAIRRGAAKLPLQFVSAIAVIANLDVAYLMRVALEEYQPGLLAQMEDLIGGTLLSDTEKTLIDSFRYIARGADTEPVLMDRAAILAIITT